MCGGVLEKDLTLDVARRIDRLLESEGVATVMTRLGDTYVSLADRAAFANRVSGCIFVSIHFNEDNQPISTGVETYYAAHQITPGSFGASWLPFLWRALSESPNLESQNLAGFVQEALVARTAALDAWTIGHMTLQTDDAKELPERAAVLKYRQERLADTGIEAGILERDANRAIRYRALLDKELRALIND